MPFSGRKEVAVNSRLGVNVAVSSTASPPVWPSGVLAHLDIAGGFFFYFFHRLFYSIPCSGGRNVSCDFNGLLRRVLRYRWGVVSDGFRGNTRVGLSNLMTFISLLSESGGNVGSAVGFCGCRAHSELRSMRNFLMSRCRCSGRTK